MDDESLKMVHDAVQFSKRRGGGGAAFVTSEQRRLAELESQLEELNKQLANERTSAAVAAEKADKAGQAQIHALALLREEDLAEVCQLQQWLLQEQNRVEAIEASKRELIQTWQTASEAERLRAEAAESALASFKAEISALQDVVANGAADVALQRAQLQSALEEQQELNAALQAQLASLTAQLTQERSTAESAAQSVLHLTSQLGKAHRAFSELQRLRVRDVQYLLMLVAGLVAVFWTATFSGR